MTEFIRDQPDGTHGPVVALKFETASETAVTVHRWDDNADHLHVDISPWDAWRDDELKLTRDMVRELRDTFTRFLGDLETTKRNGG